MLQTILIDSRAHEYTDYAEFSFRMGEQNVRTLGFFEYQDNVINIPMEEIGRMGQWLRDNPNAEISQEFYGSRNNPMTYQMKHIKEKCKISRTPLNMIKNSYESIKILILNAKEKMKIQEEGVR